VDVAHGELVEKELTAFVERRDRQRRRTEGERLVEEAWMESERRHREKRKRENRAAWYSWHLDQAERHRRTLKDLIRHHETQAARLREDRGEGIC
jgi:hypothetical protein